MDGSKRSGHSNAYFMGIFKEKRIVLYDTLIKQCEENEILAILCHEFGHWFYNHVLKNILFALFMIYFYIYAFNYFIKSRNEIFEYPVILKLLFFGNLVNFINPLINLVRNGITRYYERQADVFAVKKGYGEDLKKGLIKIHLENRSNICVDGWYSTYYHSHPTLFERIELIDSELKKME